MEDRTLLDAFGMKQFYEETKRGKFDHLRSAVPYGEPAEYASVHFLHFADEQEILSCVPYAFALRLRDALPGLIEQAKAFAKENGLICCYLSTTGAVFDFSDIHIDKERPDRFYLGFDAGDAPDSDPENFEYLELYRYIGFDEDLHPTGDWYDETIWR